MVTYGVGTQKNRLNETVLLSTQTNVKTDVLEIYHNLSLKILDFLMYG